MERSPTTLDNNQRNLVGEPYIRLCVYENQVCFVDSDTKSDTGSVDKQASFGRPLL